MSNFRLSSSVFPAAPAGTRGNTRSVTTDIILTASSLSSPSSIVQEGTTTEPLMLDQAAIGNILIRNDWPESVTWPRYKHFTPGVGVGTIASASQGSRTT
eukprot:4920756-Pyramimonas_sp.AAC.1